MEISRQTKITVAALAGVAVIVLFSTVLFDLSLERAILLAPLLVVSFGIVAGLIVFWGKVALHQWRGEDSNHEH